MSVNECQRNALNIIRNTRKIEMVYTLAKARAGDRITSSMRVNIIIR